MISLHIYYFAIFFCKDRFFFFLFKMEGVQKIKFLSDFEQKKKTIFAKKDCKVV